MFKEEDIIEVNNKDFLITHKIEYDNDTYYYMTNIETKEVTLVKEDIVDNESILKNLTDDNLIKNVLSQIIE